MRFGIRGDRPAPDVVVVGIEDRTLRPSSGETAAQPPVARPGHPSSDEGGREGRSPTTCSSPRKAATRRVHRSRRCPDPGGPRRGAQSGDGRDRGARRTARRASSAATRGSSSSKARPVDLRLRNDVDGRIRARRVRAAAVSRPSRSPPHASSSDIRSRRRRATPRGSTPRAARHDPLSELRRRARRKFDPPPCAASSSSSAATAPSLQDRHSTSTSSDLLMAGPEIQAASAVTALKGFPLRSAPWWLDALLVVALGAIVPLLALRLRIACCPDRRCRGDRRAARRRPARVQRTAGS